jgi:hypothetical protein
MIYQKFMKLCTLQDPNMKMCTLVVYPGPSSFPRNKSLKVVFQICLGSIKRHNRGKTQWTIQSFKLQSSHIMILSSTKFGGNRTKDVEVGPDRWTDRQTDSYIPPKLCSIDFISNFYLSFE